MPTHETPQETLEEILAQVEDLTLPSQHIALQEAQAMLPKVHTAAELMSIIRGGLDSDVVVGWVNTGGGCMVIEARLKDARDDVYLYITPSTDTFGRDDFGLPVDTQGEGYLICSYIGEECEPYACGGGFTADELHDGVRRMSLAAEIEAGNREAAAESKQVRVKGTFTLEIENGNVTRVVLNQQSSDYGDIVEVTRNQYRSTASITEAEFDIVCQQNWPTPELES